VNIVYLVVTTPDFQRIAVRNGAAGPTLPRWDGIGRIPPTSKGPQLPSLATCVGPTDIVHWAPLPPRDCSDGSDVHYCLAVAEGNHANGRFGDCEDLIFEERETLLTGDLLAPREQSALQTALARLEAPAALFDSEAAVKTAIDWARQRIVDTTGARIDSTTRYRQQRHDLIVRFGTDRGTLYLKAGKERFADEAMLTGLLETLLPDRVPKTLALDPLGHRWLYRELPGIMLSQTALDREAIVAAVQALAALQQVTIGSEPIVRHVARRRQTAVELFDVVDDKIERAWRPAHPSDARDAVVGAWRSLRQSIRGTCAAVDRLDIPLALVPSDFGAHNIVMTPQGIGFIDLGHSFWSCPVLPLWRFVRDLKWRLRSSDAATRAAVRRAIGTAFVEAWRPGVPAQAMTLAIGYMWLIGRLFGIQIAACDLDAYEDAVGTTLPEGYRAARLAARVRDLMQAFAQRAITPGVAPALSSALDL
jgi:hypothetical protein